MDIKVLPSIDAASFFLVSHVCVKASEKTFFAKPQANIYQLPLFADYLHEDAFGAVSLSWSEEGLFLFVKVDKPFEDSFFPDVQKGDAFECFIDTKGLGQAHTFHKYCHHFVFLPKEVDGLIGAELSSFRGEDRHELADASKFLVRSRFLKHGYEMEIVIPEISLFGYSPEEEQKIFFAYRLHRKGGNPMHFPMSGLDYQIESQPLLWAKIRLTVL